MSTFEQWKEEQFFQVGDRLLSWCSVLEFTHSETGGDDHWRLVRGKIIDFTNPELVECIRPHYRRWTADGKEYLVEEFFSISEWKKEVSKNEEDKEKSMQENDKEVSEYSRAFDKWVKAQKALEEARKVAADARLKVAEVTANIFK